MTNAKKIGSSSCKIKRKIKICPELLLFLMIAFVNENYLYLFPRNLLYSVTQDILLCWGLFVFFRLKNGKIGYKYRHVIILVVLISLLSVFRAYIISGEPFLYAFEETRSMFVILLYFPIRCIVDRYGVENFLSVVVKFGNFVSLLLIIQWVLYPNIIFLHTASGERFGNYRTYNFLALTIFQVFYYLSKMYKEKITFSTYLLFSINAFAFVFVQQTKSAMFAVAGAAFCVFVLDNQRKRRINKFVFAVFMLLLFVIAKDYLFLVYSQAKGALSEAKLSVTGNVGIRIRAIEFVVKSLKESYLFGLGYYSGHWSESNYITGWAYGYAMGDIGFVAHIFHVGILGFGVAIYYLAKLTVNIFRIKRESRYASFGKMVVIYWILISPFNFYFTSSNMLFYLVIYTCIFEAVLEGEKLHERKN